MGIEFPSLFERVFRGCFTCLYWVGAFFAALISINNHDGFLWGMIHLFLSWLYVLYYAFS